MESSSSKIGIGVITYNRPEYYKQVLKSLESIDNQIRLVIVNDGINSYANESDGDFVIKNNKQLGVAVSKNLALKILIEKFKCEHLFLIEDDILIKNQQVFDEYIKAANSTGIHHLCYEKIAGNKDTLKYVLEQPDGVKVGFYFNPQGAFMYINANLIKRLGYFDESYMNAFEHVDFSYNLTKNKVAPSFWYFPDLLNSHEYITDIEGSSDNSSISNKENYKENVAKSGSHFVEKWGHFTIDIPEDDLKTFQSSLIYLQYYYSRKRLINKGQKLSIIIPYRDRQTALEKLIPSLREYVSKQVDDFEIFVVEQNNDKPFNKGLLNNIGFGYHTGSYVCFHDVDLIPEFADYSYPVSPTHMSSHCSQFNYVNIPDKIMGGVILFNNKHYLQVNGYSNEYSGWGKEDDDLYHRCERENLYPYKHPFGRYYSVPHVHRLSDPVENLLHNINGRRFRSFVDGELDKNYYKIDGLNNCSEKIKSVSIEDLNDYKKILVNF